MSAGLWDAFEETRPPGYQLRVWTGDEFRTLTWDAWREGARRAAAGLVALGVREGDRVACVLTNAPDVCCGAVGVWLAGATVVSLPTPARGLDLETYRAQLRRCCAIAETDLLLAEAQFAESLREVLPELRVVAWQDLPSGRATEPRFPADAAFVQFSSGSTQEPRGCVLSAAAIESQLDILSAGLELDDEDIGVSWLPLSHDMGFFGCLMLSFAKGMRLTVSSPQRFLRSPRSWWADCVDVGATITAAPNFALDLAGRAGGTPRGAPCPMRKCVVGGERVEAATLDAACEELAPFGLSREALMPAYGLAEGVLAVTMTPLDRSPRVITVDAAALREDRFELCEDDAPGGSRLVSAGPPLREVGVRALGGGEVGEIEVRSPSLAAGYLGDPEATAERFVDGGLHTRDVGFLHDGELYINGRLDDMLNVAGRTVWVRDIESKIAREAPIRPGSCVLVETAANATGTLVLVCEAKPGASAQEIARVGERVTHEFADVRLAECVILEAGQLPKTPSGKVQRYRCREVVQSGGGREVARLKL